jgi:hypothetical protein
MKKTILTIIAVALVPTCLPAVDGQVLVSQASVAAAGGFPYVITQAGSYKLSGNLTPPAGTDAIHINSNNVTLDLNGFTIGSAACVPDTCDGGSTYGIMSSSTHPHYNITVRNGIISGMGVGVYLNGDSFTVEDLHVRNITGDGIVVTWTGGNDPGSVIVRRNTLDGARVGLHVTGSALVADNTFSFNITGASIGNEFSTTVSPALVTGNTFYSNFVSLALYHGGYSNNVFSGGAVAYGKNLGGNLCNNVVCP